MDAVPFELTKETAEGVVKRAMAPLREIMDQYKDEPDGGVEVTLTLHEVRSVDGDLGVLGLTLAQQFAKQKGWQDALELFAQENVRLHATVDVLTHHAVQLESDVESLSSRLVKTETVNTKLKELSTSTGEVIDPGKFGFKKPDLV